MNVSKFPKFLTTETDDKYVRERDLQDFQNNFGIQPKSFVNGKRIKAKPWLM